MSWWSEECWAMRIVDEGGVILCNFLDCSPGGLREAHIFDMRVGKLANLLCPDSARTRKPNGKILLREDFALLNFIRIRALCCSKLCTWCIHITRTSFARVALCTSKEVAQSVARKSTVPRHPDSARRRKQCTRRWWNSFNAQIKTIRQYCVSFMCPAPLCGYCSTLDWKFILLWNFCLCSSQLFKMWHKH